jgi:4-oxalocrotonate tautomerase
MRHEPFQAHRRVAARAETIQQLENDRKNNMPLLNVKLMEGVFTPAQKQDMIRKLTDTMVSIEGESLRPLTLVVIEEVKSGAWGVGGTSYSTSDVKAVVAGAAKA